MKSPFRRCRPDILEYMVSRTPEALGHDPEVPNLQELPQFFQQVIFEMLDRCSSTCLALTCKAFYEIYSFFGQPPVRLNHIVVLKAKRRGKMETTYITLHYLLKDFMGPHWIWDSDHGIFRPKEKAGKAMSDDEFQEWLKFNRSRGKERGCGWRGMGGKVVVRDGIISKTFE
jgi:hypothetical protein